MESKIVNFIVELFLHAFDHNIPWRLCLIPSSVARRCPITVKLWWRPTDSRHFNLNIIQESKSKLLSCFIIFCYKTILALTLNPINSFALVILTLINLKLISSEFFLPLLHHHSILFDPILSCEGIPTHLFYFSLSRHLFFFYRFIAIYIWVLSLINYLNFNIQNDKFLVLTLQ